MASLRETFKSFDGPLSIAWGTFPIQGFQPVQVARHGSPKARSHRTDKVGSWRPDFIHTYHAVVAHINDQQPTTIPADAVG